MNDGMKIDPVIRQRLSPVLDDLIEQLVESGLDKNDALQALSILTYESILDGIPDMLGPEQTEAVLKAMKEAGI